MRVLALDAALWSWSVGLVINGELATSRQGQAGRGAETELPAATAAVLAGAHLAAPSLDLVAVTVGPGSFTGIRAALSLAHGLALAAGIPVVGVTVGEALSFALPHLGGRAFWSAVDSRRGRVFLEWEGSVAARGLDELPATAATARIAVGGDAAIAVAAGLAARDVDVMLTDVRRPGVRQVVEAATARQAGQLAPLPVQPLYVDPPQARPPASGLRPAPRVP